MSNTPKKETEDANPTPASIKKELDEVFPGVDFHCSPDKKSIGLQKKGTSSGSVSAARALLGCGLPIVILSRKNHVLSTVALRKQRQMLVTLSIFKLVDFSVSKAYELKSLSSLARAGVDGRDFLNMEVRGFVCEQGVRAEVAV